jgi:hypothetical protein
MKRIYVQVPASAKVSVALWLMAVLAAWCPAKLKAQLPMMD